MTKKEKLQEELTEHYKMYYDSIHSPQVISLNEDLWNQHLIELEQQLAELKEEEISCEKCFLFQQWTPKDNQFKEPKQSAEEFLKSKCLFTYAEIELIAPLLEEYRQHGIPAEEEIEKKFECHANSKCYMEGAKWMLNKWKGEK